MLHVSPSLSVFVLSQPFPQLYLNVSAFLLCRCLLLTGSVLLWIPEKETTDMVWNTVLDYLRLLEYNYMFKKVKKKTKMNVIGSHVCVITFYIHICLFSVLNITQSKRQKKIKTKKQIKDLRKNLSVMYFWCPKRYRTFDMEWHLY